MELLSPKRCYRGCIVPTPWSQRVIVVDVIYSVKIHDLNFHGIRVKNTDMNWDWPNVENLLWVAEDGTGLQLWTELKQSPIIVNGQVKNEVQCFIGEYQSLSGNIYIGVKWREHDCPSWVLEEDLMECSDYLEWLSQA